MKDRGHVSPGKGKDEANFETTGSRKENDVRVSRKKSPISTVAIRRTIQAAMKAGLPIGRLEVETDGTISLSVVETPRPAPPTPEDIFREWESRL
jgi:hypothetical protein